MGSLTETVMQFMEQELKKDPRVKNADLFAGACEIDPSIADLSRQQFHGKYRLQAGHRLAKAAAGTRTATAPKAPAATEPEAPAAEQVPAAAVAPAGTGDRAAVRALLLDFAREFAVAGSQAETIEVIARLDAHAADIMEAAQR